MAKHSSHGIIQDDQAQEQPADKERGAPFRSDPKKSATTKPPGTPDLTMPRRRQVLA